MTVEIRSGDAHDVDAIMPVMHSAFDLRFGEAWSAEQCRGVLILPGTMLAVASQAAAVTGFALWRFVLEEAELLLIAVEPGQQSRGLGTCLFDHVVREAAQKGVTRLHVEVRSDNPARSFYTGRGFAQIGPRPNYYRRDDNGPKDAITLCLDFGKVRSV